MESAPIHPFAAAPGDFSHPGLLRRDPWPHWVIDGFLDPRWLRRCTAELLASNPTFQIQPGDAEAVQYALLEHLPLAQVFYSPAFHALLQALTGLPLRLNDDNWVQLRRMDASSPRFPPHVDDLERRSLIAVFYLSPGWRRGCGGELCLHSGLDAPPTRRVAPLENRLLLFFSDAHCWHSIRAVHGWERYTILSEWLVQGIVADPAWSER